MDSNSFSYNSFVLSGFCVSLCFTVRVCVVLVNVHSAVCLNKCKKKLMPHFFADFLSLPYHYSVSILSIVSSLHSVHCILDIMVDVQLVHGRAE